MTIQANNIDNKGKHRSIRNLKLGNCIFPFTYKHVTYNNCVNGKSGYWCATKLTKNNTAENWAYCILDTKSKKKIQLNKIDNVPNNLNYVRNMYNDPKIVKLFYSKSKDIDDLKLNIPNWRKILSNFHNIIITVDGKKYPSVEHYFQAAKSLCSDKPEMAELFELENEIGKYSPKDAKSAGGKGAYKKYKAILDFSKWNNIRDEVMIKAIKARMLVDKEYCDILEATKKQDIYLLHYERNPKKSYWGGGISKENSKEIIGDNKLGKILMELR